MSWPGFHALSAAWLFLLVIPLVTLYFLKLKRPTMRVPSLALWASVMQDQRVNSPFQRFKRNLLLWLQLLLLCLLVLAAMSPFLRGTVTSDRIMVLLDRSASMAALDKRGGLSRLSVAKTRIRKVIEGLSPNQELCLIAFGKTAQQVAAFTNAQRVLLDALDGIEVRHVASDVVDALRMAGAMARNQDFDRVILYSDGNVPAEIEFDLPFELEFEKLPAGGVNIGITGLQARRDGDRGWEVLATVHGSEDANVPCQIEVYQNQQQMFSEDVHLGVDGFQRFVFPILAEQRSALEFRLECAGFDALDVDNRAYLVLDEVRPLRVLVYRESGSFLRALKAFNDVELDTTPDTSKSYDLVVARGEEGVPQAPTALNVGSIPESLSSVVSSEVLRSGTDAVADWRRDHPLLEHMEMSELLLGQRLGWQAGRDETDLESQRYSVLVWGGNGPLIVTREDGGLVRYDMLFNPSMSTLPYRVAFPIFCHNLVKIAMRRAGLLEVLAQQTGVIAPLTLEIDSEYELRGPRGALRVRTNKRGELTGVSARAVGIYTVTGPGHVLPVGVSLLSHSETSLASVDDLQMNELSVSSREAGVATDRSIWSILASFALIVLLLEWWFFQVRPGGFKVLRAR